MFNNRAFKIGKIEIVLKQPRENALETPRKVIFRTSDRGNVAAKTEIADQANGDNGYRRGGGGQV